ncbi:MAG: MBL fold metallo-hydrolase [Candidatus Bathyarchaeia archaeon]|jgi:glyoxylase-like metal-dependent hydrolase (beta-lactamase superfamily II)
MMIETFTVGMLSTNCYVVSSEKGKEAIVIDPGLDLPFEAQQIFDYVAKEKLKIKLILNTHGHQDHISGDVIFQEKYNVPIYIHKYDASSIEELETSKFPAPVLLEDGSLIKFDDESLTVMLTPGHTPGSICLVSKKLVFTGDTLFNEGIGRTDFPEGSMKDMQASLQKLVRLPDYLLIYPGHGPTSIIGEEKRKNPFLVGNDF